MPMKQRYEPNAFTLNPRHKVKYLSQLFEITEHFICSCVDAIKPK